MNARVKELFDELANLPSEARTRYFAEHDVDEETRNEVEELLAFDSGASAFLMRDISDAANRSLPQLESKGRRCGPYRLLDLIGRGGMGAVYLAERADGEVTQRLAVKLLPPGAGDPLHERFLQERQILASLTHPNIARMLDAGHVENGQPFLAMEYVDGKPIDVFTAWCSTRQKIALFLKVCAAVGYLHRNLVVHRDLKPSNILVTADGEPKLLDFGIAKILDVATDSTMTSMRMLTPDYASPEQVTGGRVSTATDIYSLGAVLYQLLTGKPAHEFAEHSSEAIAQVVTSREVTRPSKWSPELKGDLEFILLKALRKDPQERYGTVEQFAEDLQAFLESRTVRARSGNAWYRTRKFLRRYWVPVTAAALVIASLAVGLAVANRQRVVAQRRFQDVRQLANKLFDIDAQVRQLPGSTKARQFIVDTSLEYLRRLRADVSRDPELALEVGNAYMLMARVEGVPNIGPNLGHMDNAERDLEIADGLIQSVLGSQPANRTALLRAAEIAKDRMVVEAFRDHDDQQRSWARKSADWLEKFNAGNGDRQEASAILDTYARVAYEFMRLTQLDEAIQLCRRGSDLARSYNLQSERGGLLRITAQILQYRGDLDEALKQIRESAKLLDPGDGGYRQTVDFCKTLQTEGDILGEEHDISLGRSDEAVRVLERVFNIEDNLVHKDPNDQTSRQLLAASGTDLAAILRHSDPSRALAVYDHALRHMREVSTAHTQYVILLAGSSYALRGLGRSTEARRRLDTAFASLRDRKLYPAEKVEAYSDADLALRALADHEGDTGNVPHAIQIYQELVARLEAGSLRPEIVLSDGVVLSYTFESMAALYRRSGRSDLASALESRRRDLWRQWDRKLPNNPFVLRQLRKSAA